MIDPNTLDSLTAKQNEQNRLTKQLRAYNRMEKKYGIQPWNVRKIRLIGEYDWSRHRGDENIPPPFKYVKSEVTMKDGTTVCVPENWFVAMYERDWFEMIESDLADLLLRGKYGSVSLNFKRNTPNAMEAK